MRREGKERKKTEVEQRLSLASSLVGKRGGNLLLSLFLLSFFSSLTVEVGHRHGLEGRVREEAAEVCDVEDGLKGEFRFFLVLIFFFVVAVSG